MAARAVELREGNLPTKSKPTYQRIYNEYASWCETKDVDVGHEDSFLVYVDYLMTAKEQSGSTMAKNWSAVKRVLTAKGTDCTRWVVVGSYVARLNKEHVAVQAAIWSQCEIELFISTAADADYIMHKLAILLCFAGRLRPVDLHGLKRSDFKEVTDKDGIVELKVSCLIRKTSERIWFLCVGPTVAVYVKYMEITSLWEGDEFWYVLCDFSHLF